MTVASGAASPGGSAARLVARGLLLPAVAGAACVLGFAPFYLWPVPILALAVLFHAWGASGSPLQAALSGFAFGLGLFLAGVSWVFVSLHEFGAMPAVLAAVATFLFCAFLALFPALAGWIANRLTADGWWRRLAAMPAAYVLVEWVRGWVFTGFPWLNAGTSQVPGSPLAGFAPLAGGYGLSLAVALAAALLAGLLRSLPWSGMRLRMLAALVLLFALGGVLRAIEWTKPDGPAVLVSLLQGNVSQHLKWKDEVRAATFELYRQLIVAAPGRVVVLPETALPAFLDRLPEAYVEGLRAHARDSGKEILLGTVERLYEGERFRYYNSVVRLAGGGDAQSFRKSHLVPFGEFIPPGFGWVLQVLQIPLTDFQRGGPGQPPIAAGGVRFGIAICFEDIFGEEVIGTLPAAQVLLNVTNDAWFGESLAADQHLQSSQVRALESGRWMLRSTNTGVTAAIDPKGRVVERLPAFTAGTLTREVVPYAGMTPYAVVGNAAAILPALLLFALALWRRRARS